MLKRFFYLLACISGLGSMAAAQTINYNIRLNQIGFYPDLEKVAIVAGNPAAGNFYVRSLDLATIYYTGTLGASATWSFSGETVRAADFSAFTTPGTYILEVQGVGYSPVFKIAPKVHHDLSRTSLRALYLNRSSTAITAANGGVYARAAGHPDNSVRIHPSAASTGRPAGTIVSSPKGWYDAGDYNSYIVNSGITTFTLLSAYEHFTSYYDTINLNIPESGNGVPDILNEIRWNLDWMLTMQDPADGGVYNKKTSPNFSGFVMPAADVQTRYLVAKGTAAAFDFAAVMAVAYRVYKPFDLTFANTCLAASQSAYNWGIANPNVAFNNPTTGPAVVTGGYGDNNFTDEREWAATELYISTLNNAYYANSFKNANTYGIPAWPQVRTLGLISLVHHKKNLTATGYADTTNIKNKLFALANPIRTHKTTASAYKTGMGSGGNGDFSWGSNSFALNQGFICLSAYMITKDVTYLNTALSELDYILGRNGTTYCFVTGFGTKQVMHPHHRISEADGVVNPLPGMMAGGPNPGQEDGCAGYPSSQRALSYVDDVCSYASNEVAINWNAPMSFVAAGLEYAVSNAPLPVELISFEGRNTEDGNVLTWKSASEKEFGYYELEYAEDGKVFSPLLKVPSQGQGNNIRTYQSTDASANRFKNMYYRLKMVDLDGSTAYSYVVYLPGESFSDRYISVFPNPAQNNVTVKTSIGDSLTLTLYNELGLKIWTGALSDGTEAEIPLSRYPAGLYLLYADTGDAVLTRKIIKY